jgi:signal transduction histidine kinase
MTARTDNGSTDLERVCQRLEHLYEISKLFASFETVEQTFDPALAIAARTLSLRSAILIQTEDGRSKMIVWCSEGQSPEQMRAVKEHLEKSFGYLVGATSTGSVDRSERAGITALPRREGTAENPAHRFIVIPLVVAHRPPFGALQLEGAQPFDETDLMFVNAIANQLAIALDRDRVRRRDITRLEHAEEERTQAETTGATSERGRLIAEGSSTKYEALAAENARLYEQAQQAVRVREQILAIVSHDLRNPVGTILMATTLLAQPEEPGEVREDLSRSVGRIRRAAERMLRLIDDLLDFASIEAGSLAIKRQAHDPGSMIQETLASFEGVANKRRLQLAASVETPLPKLDGDRDRILQVLSNLVGNATKVTAEGGHIEIHVEARGHDLLFAVSDDGPGISEENLKFLFERYWRSADATYKGTGLGLAIARGIVNAHGGRIWAESELGHGAKFLFTIPAAGAAGRRPDETASDGH